jgi:hypothetical protein
MRSPFQLKARMELDWKLNTGKLIRICFNKYNFFLNLALGRVGEKTEGKTTINYISVHK